MNKRILKTWLWCAAVALTALRAHALDGAVVIASEDAPAASLTAEELKDILTGKTMYWSGGQAVTILYVGDTDAALQTACGMNSSQFKTHWQRIAFSGRGQAPKKADDVAGLVTQVAATKGAIAIAPANAELKGVKQIEVK